MSESTALVLAGETDETHLKLLVGLLRPVNLGFDCRCVDGARGEAKTVAALQSKDEKSGTGLF